MPISFRNRLIVLFTFLLGFALLTSTVSVSRAINNTARVNAERELLVAQRVFDTLLEENSRQLTDRTALLAEDFAFRQAIATNEEETIISALVNHGERISADLILLLDPEGNVMISTHNLGVTLQALDTKIQQQNTPFSELMVSEELPFQLVLVPVKAPELIAWVGVGFVIDSTLINSFREITNTNVSLLYQEKDNQPTQVLSTIEDVNHNLELEPLPFDQVVSRFDQSFISRDWLTRQSVLLDRSAQKITLVLSVSLEKAISVYQNLQKQMLSIALAVLMLGILASVFISASLTRPIGILISAARRIAKGDYLQPLAISNKNELSVLGDTLNLMQSDIQEREQRIWFQAQHDMITGLPNRHYMAELLQARLEEAPNHCFEVLLLKIINFEALNDIYGLSVMDRLLQQAAQRIRQYLQDTDTAGLVESDEFLIFCNVSDNNQEHSALRPILNLFNQPVMIDGIELTLDVRLGIVLCPDQAEKYEDVLRRSHIALSEARIENTLQKTYSKGLEDRYLRKLRVTQRLQQAICENNFSLLFQPQFDLVSQHIHSAEALIRWHDAELGPVYPDEFIPLAESSGDITLITDWVFQEALFQMSRWNEAGYSMGVSINLSARDILNDRFINGIVTKIEACTFDPKLLMLEVTETAFMSDTEHALINLRRLYDAGVRLAMDDFGTGFSSLAQLKVMPVHELKVDKSFVLNLDADQDDQKIVRSTIEMAHHLGLSVIAEGVENRASLTQLIGMNCDAIQGYFLSKPLPSEQVIQWLGAFCPSQLEAKSD